MVTAAPLRARALAIAAPMPFSRAEPVTMATLFSSDRVSGAIVSNDQLVSGGKIETVAGDCVSTAA